MVAITGGLLSGTCSAITSHVLGLCGPVIGAIANIIIAFLLAAWSQFGGGVLGGIISGIISGIAGLCGGGLGGGVLGGVITAIIDLMVSSVALIINAVRTILNAISF